MGGIFVVNNNSTKSKPHRGEIIHFTKICSSLKKGGRKILNLSASGKKSRIIDTPHHWF